MFYQLFSQLIFSILTPHCKQNFFELVQTKVLKSKKGFLIFRYFFRHSLNFFLSLFIFEEIFCWIAVLFSFCFNPNKINYVCKECKKELETSLWLNKVRLQLISRFDLCSLKVLAHNFIKQRKTKKKFHLQNLTKLVRKS